MFIRKDTCKQVWQGDTIQPTATTFLEYTYIYAISPIRVQAAQERGGALSYLSLSPQCLEQSPAQSSCTVRS